jgi:hypothetical protein
MRLSRRVLATVVAAGTVAAAAALVIPSAAAAVNLLANPGFESGNLSGWTCEAGAAAVSGQARSRSLVLDDPERTGHDDRAQRDGQRRRIRPDHPQHQRFH